jgi:uncharacterized membrane protein YfcA
VSFLEVVVVTFVVAAGACVQGTVGFGLGLVGAPLLAMIDKDFVPGPLLFVGVPLTILVALRERASLDFHGIRWALAGRVPGTIAGSIAVAALSERMLTLVLGASVLLAVVLSTTRWHPRPSTATLLTAGAASGIMGTATSIGGPPIALVYQRHSGPQLRSTMAAYFVVGAALSLATLAVAGEFRGQQLRLGLVLLPGVLIGFSCSRAAATVLDRGHTRAAVLAAAAVASLLLIAGEVL